MTKILLPVEEDSAGAAALRRLDKASEEIAAAVAACAQLVNEGELESDIVMLKLNEMAARMMMGGA